MQRRGGGTCGWELTTSNTEKAVTHSYWSKLFCKALFSEDPGDKLANSPRLTRVDKHREKLPDTLASESVEDDKCFSEQSKIEVLD